MCANSATNLNKTIEPAPPSSNKDVDAKKVVATAALLLLLMYFTLNFLWLFRIGSLAHWSYLVGVAVYPENAKYSMRLSASLFLFISIGSFIPHFLCPRLKNIAMMFSIPPQLHMLLLLNKLSESLEKYVSSTKTITTIVRIYTLTTLTSVIWTIFNIFL